MSIFKGVCTALVTPFSADSKSVDYESFKRLIDFQIENNVSALLFLGTTGEPATLSQDEKYNIAKFAIEYVNKRVPVLIGSGSNSTQHTIEDSIYYESLGADGLLIVTPYYNKCTQNGLVEHYRQVAASVNIPIIVYSVPGRTGVNILPDTVAKLKNIKNIAGIKEASGNIEQIGEIAAICEEKFVLYSGDDALTYVFLSLGGLGVISVASNVVPKQMADLCKEYEDGNHVSALKLQFNLNKLIKLLFSEVNPIPVKYAVSKTGIIQNSLRMPLTKLTAENMAKLDIELGKFL